jgi:hypothetical protein
MHEKTRNITVGLTTRLGTLNCGLITMSPHIKRFKALLKKF